MDNEKICPTLYGAWLSYKGETHQQDRQDILCMKEDCAQWNSEAEECGLIVKKVIIKK